MTILYDEKICVRCLACVSESECGGVTYDGQIHFDESKPEDWDGIAAICPVGAIQLRRSFDGHNNVCILFNGVDFADACARPGHPVSADQKPV